MHSKLSLCFSPNSSNRISIVFVGLTCHTILPHTNKYSSIMFLLLFVESEGMYINISLFQVEGAVTRAYNRWIEDLTSLPEYQTSLQMEKEKWEDLQGKITEQRVCDADFVFENVSILSSEFFLLIICFRSPRP